MLMPDVSTGMCTLGAVWKGYFAANSGRNGAESIWKVLQREVHSCRNN